MGLLIAIFFASCWIFIVALGLGFQNFEGILIFIGIFWGVIIVGGITKGFIDSHKEKQNNLDDLQINSFDEGENKAIEIINKLQWTPTGSMQSREKRYVTFRYSPNNIEDFDWLVKYISHSGCWAEILADDWVYNKYAIEQITNDPYATMATNIGDSLFKCRKVNSDYTTTEIVRIPKNEQENKRIIESRYSRCDDLGASSKSKVIDTQRDNIVNAAKQLMAQYPHIINNHEDAAPLPPMAKLHLTRTKCLVEKRFKKDPVVQYNLQLLKEKEAELKEKKEEYLKMRNWDNDDVLISLSTSSTIDIEEYKEKIEELKDEIEELKDEIVELKEELEEIKEEIEDEIEDEGFL